MQSDNLRELLEQKTLQYHQPVFIEDDPISIPHLFSRHEDIEIAGFLTAIISWGQRKSIIQSSRLLMKMMDDSPWHFVMNAGVAELKCLSKFVYRTLNGDDLLFIVEALRKLYRDHESMENAFVFKVDEASFTMFNLVNKFRERLLEVPHLQRSEKHLGHPLKGSAAKRINMFLRWMVRSSDSGVDFGLWTKIKPSQLCIPLDLHVGRVARELGLLNRRQDDWKAVEELTAKLRTFDENDPIKYDFALFGMGRYEKFKL